MVRYFAFGSNMCTARLTARLAAVRCLGRGKLVGWDFACNKSGLDGSAKANLVPRPGAAVWGVMFEFPLEQLDQLDAIEGGYRRITVSVEDGRGQRRRCETYVSTSFSDSHTPFDWYRQLLVAGAREHRLPERYVAMLAQLPARRAPDGVGDRRGLPVPAE